MRLSIITINLNNDIGLQKTIESVRKQSFRDYEYIIIDGGSTDRSVYTIKENDDYIAYWVSEVDSGIYNAMNKGISYASGNYLLFLNSGDWLFDENVLMTTFSNNFTEDIVYSNWYIQNHDTYDIINTISPEYITLRNFINNSIPHQSSLIKRSLFEIIGYYNENNKIVSDWEFFLRAIFIENCSLKKIHSPIAVYSLDGISNNKRYFQIQQNEKISALDRNFPRIIPDYNDFLKLENKPFVKFYFFIRNVKNTFTFRFRK